ncbi:MAG: hypothetical protein ACFN28_05800, partial [Rothia dentocariosa]
MTDAKTTSDTKKAQSPDHHNTGCAHTTGLPLLSAMSPEPLGSCPAETAMMSAPASASAVAYPR